jgi:hypothetical protein
MDEFVTIAGRDYEIVSVRQIRRRGRNLAWVVCHRTHRIYLSLALTESDRRAALDCAVSSGRRLVAALRAD